ncbi:MAG: hypothetical protein MHPSP_002123, partial [Paramarteilia canceri]
MEHCANQLREIMKDFKADDIFNVDEMAIVERSENNEIKRISAIFGTNMTGNEKTDPYVCVSINSLIDEACRRDVEKF